MTEHRNARDYGLDIGRNIKKQRAALGMSLGDVSRETGLSKTHILAIERGASANPTIVSLIILSEALQMTMSQILGADISQPRLSHEELELIQCHRRIFARKGTA